MIIRVGNKFTNHASKKELEKNGWKNTGEMYDIWEIWRKGKKHLLYDTTTKTIYHTYEVKKNKTH